MAPDASNRSRRALLTGAAGAVAATAAAAIAAPLTALATGSDHAPVTVGDAFTQASLTTTIAVSTGTNDVLALHQNGTGGQALAASSVAGAAINASSESSNDAAIVGRGRSGNAGVAGYSRNDDADVTDIGPGGFGVYGELSDRVGVFGTSTSGTATQGVSNSGLGVYGQSNSTSGVYGYCSSSTAPAVVGQAEQSIGVLGFVGLTAGPLPAFPANTGVTGVASVSAASVGVRGQSATGRGGVFKGKLASVRLTPSTANHPASGQAGDLFVDKANHLWFCRGGSTWVKLA